MMSSCTQARKQAAQSRIFSLFALASRSPAVSQPLAKLTVRLRTARKRLRLQPLAELTDPWSVSSFTSDICVNLLNAHHYLQNSHHDDVRGYLGLY